MKQSTKLLSLVLALVMAFSCVGVIANAGLVKDDITYDRVDDAVLSAEQVADLALDLVDSDVMYSINKGKTMDLSILGEIRTDTIDHMLADVYDLYSGFWWAIGKGLLGDAGDLDLSMLKNLQRSGGDLNVIYGLLKLLGCDSNANILSKAAYGIGTKNGLDLGLIESFIDLGDTGDILNDLPGYLAEYAYDELIHGSYSADYADNDYSYPSLDSLKADKKSLPADVDTFDEMVDQLVYALLTQPQDYSWVKNDDDTSTKVWDMDSVVFPSIASAYDKATITSAVSPNTHSLFEILDTLAPFAINDLGIAALNNNLKKQLMEAVEVEFNEIDESKLPADAKAAFAAEDEYVTYISYDRMYKSGNAWYYTTLKRTEVIDLTTGEAKVDEKGNKVTEQVRKYYKANTSTANEFYDLINWDYEFVADSNPLAVNDTQELNCIDYEYLISTYGSIFGSLNHLIYVVYELGLTSEIKASFEATTGNGWVDGINDDCLMDNLERLGKFLLAEFGDKIFGKGSAYANISYDSIADKSIIDLVATMGPEFFADAMPQLIMPKNADGTYAFGNDNQLLKFGALVIREFVTEVSPATNYDEYIFAEGTVTSANDRQFATHDSDEWFNIILNMGMDVAYTYLDQLTNFEEATPAVDVTEERWQGMLDSAIIWAVNYVGSEGSSVLIGLDPDTVSAVDGPLNKLSFVLNKILPLGFITGCTTEDYACDVNALFERIKGLLTDFDLNAVLGLFGRNEDAYNILNEPVIEMVVNLLNQILGLVFGADIFPAATSLSGLVTQANLKTIVYNLLTKLYAVREGLLVNGLPVLAKFISEWGGEQELKNPDIDLKDTISLSSGAATGLSFAVENGSEGVWRGYKDASGNEYQDNHYSFNLVSVKAYNYDGSVSSYISGITYSTDAIDYGAETSVTYNVANVPAPGVVQRVDVTYTLNDEDGAKLANGQEYTKSKYVWLSANPTTTGQSYDTGKEGLYDCRTRVYYDFFVGFDPDADFAAQMAKIEAGYCSKKSSVGSKTCKFKVHDSSTQTQNGITYPEGGVKTSDAVSESGYFAVADLATATAFASVPGNSITWNVDGYANSASSVHKNIKNVPVKMTFYDKVYYDKLVDLVKSEAKALREAEEYRSSGYSYATKVLRTTDESEKLLKETNFATTGVDPDNADLGTVTKIDNAQAWATYYAALQAGIQGAWQLWNNECVFNHEELYNNLRVAAADVQYCKKSVAELEEDGLLTNVDVEVADLKATLRAAQAETTDKMDYTDYKMFRLNRFNSAVKNANNIINRQKAASLAVADDEYFTYTNITETDLRALVKDDANASIILALLEKYKDTEYAQKEAELTKAKESYANVTAIDVAQAKNLVNRMSTRLLRRDGGVQVKYLNDEIASAKAMVKSSSNYTARSWAIYSEALAAAEKVAQAPTQMSAFDAKYALQVARNGLVLVENEADYSELEALIAQATQALANRSLYDNTDKEFGQVLAELGYNTLEDADGNDIQLFPGSALLVNEKAYSTDDQKKIDRAATALKEALARLKFKGVSVSGSSVSKETLVEANEEKDIEAVTAYVSRIAALKTASDVKGMFSVSATGASSVDSVVTDDNNYALGTDLEGYVGTNSTITFYTTVGGVKVPVETVKLVVDGDVNGDGVVDVLDAVVTELTANDHATLEGCYFLAGNLDTATKEIVASDYSAVVNKVLAA